MKTNLTLTLLLAIAFGNGNNLLFSAPKKKLTQTTPKNNNDDSIFKEFEEKVEKEKKTFPVIKSSDDKEKKLTIQQVNEDKENFKKLIKHIKNGSLEEIENILKKNKFLINAHDEHKRTPLILAIYCKQKTIALALLENNLLDVNLKDNGQQSALSYTLLLKQEAIIEALLKKTSINLNTLTNKNSKESLSLTLLKQYPETFYDYALKNPEKIDFNHKDENKNTIFTHILSSHTKLVLKTLQNKKCNVDLNTKNKDGYTPFAFMLKQADEKLVKTALENTSLDINIKLEAEEGYLLSLYFFQQFPNLFLEYVRKNPTKINFNLQGQNNITLLMELTSKNPEIAIEIVQNEKIKINPNILNAEGLSVFGYALASNNNCKKIIKTLLKNNFFDIKSSLSSLPKTFLIKYPELFFEYIRNNKDKINVNMQRNEDHSIFIIAIIMAPDIALYIIENSDTLDLLTNDHGIKALECAIDEENTELADAIQKKITKQLLNDKNETTVSKKINTIDVEQLILEKREFEDLEEKEKKRDKTLKITEELPYSSIANRVILWEKNPKKAYENHVNDYEKIASKQDYRLMTQYHTFSHTVTHFIDALALKCDFTSKYFQEKETLSYNIPGQIIYTIKDDNNQTKTVYVDGIFSYGINSKTNELYHKCFTSKFNNLLIDTIEYINKRIRRNPYSLKSKIDNETIKKNEQTIDSYKLNTVQLDGNNFYTENDYCIKIDDSNNDMIIILFKQK